MLVGPRISGDVCRRLFQLYSLKKAGVRTLGIDLVQTKELAYELCRSRQLVVRQIDRPNWRMS